MTKFDQKSFGIGAPKDNKYRDNWDSVFGKKEPEAIREYENSNLICPDGTFHYWSRFEGMVFECTKCGHKEKFQKLSDRADRNNSKPATTESVSNAWNESKEIFFANAKAASEREHPALKRLGLIEAIVKLESAKKAQGDSNE